MTHMATAIYIYQHSGACLGVACVECFIQLKFGKCQILDAMAYSNCISIHAFYATDESIAPLRELAQTAYAYIVSHPEEAMDEVLC